MYRWLLIFLLLAIPTRAFAQPVDDTGDPGEPADQPTDEPADEPADTSAAPAVADEPAPAEAEAVGKVGDAPATAGEPAAEAAESEAAEEQKALSSDFMDVRLNFTLTNENVFAEPGETIPSVPGWRFGRPNSLGTLFFDNYDTRFSGYETLSHAVLYRKHDDENWEVEGALVLRLNDVAENTIDLSDAGSYIRVAHWLDPERKDPTRISLVAFPTSSDRMRLGYSYRLSWGGSDEYRRSKKAVPGIKVQYDTGKIYAYAGAKSAVVLDRETAEEEAVMGYLVGAGVDLTDMVRVEANGGFFDRGSNELQDVLSEQVQLFGGSVQVAVHDGMPVGSSIDYRLYRNDPLRVGRLFRRAEYPGGLSWLVMSEATMLGQTLKDPAVTGGTTIQYGKAADINVRIKNNRTRVRFDAQVRDLAYILHATPSLPTFSDFPDQYDHTPNFFAAVGVDQNFRDQLTVGLVVGVDMPSTLTTPTGVIPGDPVGGSGETTAVIRGEGDITIIPEGEDAAAQFAFKLTGRLDFSEYFASLIDVYYSFDPNQTRLRRDGPDDLLEREFGKFHQLGVNITLQAKF